MDGWFNWRGINSADMGVIVEQMPQMQRPQRNAKSITIPGRDGNLTMNDDSYAPIPLPIICGTKKEDMEHDLAAWLIGTGDLVLSLDASRAYKARLDNSFAFDLEGINYQRFNLQFTAQPFAYEAQPQIITLTASGKINNPGTRWSLPLITVYGAGVLTIGGYAITVEATAGEASVTINSEIEECYYSAANRNNKISGISAGFPRLDLGMTDITLGTGITKIEIQGNWRWF